jgi:hypothetical protein
MYEKQDPVNVANEDARDTFLNAAQPLLRPNWHRGCGPGIHARAVPGAADAACAGTPQSSLCIVKSLARSEIRIRLVLKLGGRVDHSRVRPPQ